MNKCKICGAPTKRISKAIGYRVYCSPQCSNSDPDKKIKAKRTCLKRYGHNSSACSENVKSKSKQTCLKRYGVTNPGMSNVFKEKRKNTCIERYGASSPMQNTLVKTKYVSNFHEKYGVNNPLQLDSVYIKNVKNSFKTKKYILPSGKIIFKQGYEPKFLDFIFQNNILKEDDIVYYPTSISYVNVNGCKAKYHPDFFIPKWNLIIEIKSKYTIDMDENVLLKENAVRSVGFNYIRISDNIFSEFISYIENIN